MEGQESACRTSTAVTIFCLFILLVTFLLFIDSDAAPVKSDITHPQYLLEKRERTFSRFLQFSVAFFIVPLLIAAILFQVNREKLPSALLGYLVAHTVTLVIIYGLKRFVAWPRPDTGTVCIDRRTLKKCRKLLATLGVKGQFKSFPSGESAISACSMSYLSLIIASWAQKKKHAYQAFIACIPVFFMFVVAASRVVDRAHSVSDVTAGTGFGVTTSGLCFALLY